MTNPISFITPPSHNPLPNRPEADRDITDYSGNKPMDYLTHQTSVSASTYSSEYNPMHPNLSINNHKQNYYLAGYGGLVDGGGIVAPSADALTGGSLKSRHTSRSTLHRLRSQRKRFATVATTAAMQEPDTKEQRHAYGSTGSQHGSRSMMDTMSLHSSGSDTTDNVFGGSTKPKGKRSNRMYQSFLFRGSSSGSKAASVKNA